jgi:hypothetical protein
MGEKYLLQRFNGGKYSLNVGVSYFGRGHCGIWIQGFK